MSALIPFLALDQPYDQVLALVNQQLTNLGFRVVQTFDLQVARLAHADCPCPHHGTDHCNCQMIVLLVYRKQDDPTTLVIHGQDGKTWLSLASPVLRHAYHQIEATIRHTFIPRRSDALSPTEVVYENRSTV